jgi:hypothetical protein
MLATAMVAGMTHLTQHLKSPAMIVAILALVLACTGSAVAASLITGAQIKDGSISGKDIKSHSVSTKNLSSSALDAMTGSQGPAGAAGVAGRAGLPGAAGPAGASGPAGLASLTHPGGPAVFQGALGSGSEVASSTATCPAGTFVTGGGYVSSIIDNVVEYAVGGATTYTVIAVNQFSQSGTIQAQAFCAGGAGVSSASAAAHSDAKPAIAELVQAMQAKVNAGP